MTHPALTADSVAVVTGGASGIGLAITTRFASLGMRVVVVDRDADALAAAEAPLRAHGAADVMLETVDVTDRAQLVALESRVADRFGGTDILVNNAGVGQRSACLGAPAPWTTMLDVNLWGPINGTQVFSERMLARGRPGAIINTGSKQGITTPPGNPGYNVSKAALKAFTEALAHELRNADNPTLSAHLLVPGFVHTPMIGLAEKPSEAWTPEQTADFLIDSLSRGDFYILCPDNETPRERDERRVAWAVGDLIENRPPLSRWHPDFADAAKRFIDG